MTASSVCEGSLFFCYCVTVLFVILETSQSRPGFSRTFVPPTLSAVVLWCTLTGAPGEERGLHLILTSKWQSILEGSQSCKLELVLTIELPGSWSVTLLTYPRPCCLGVIPPTVTWAALLQLVVKKMLLFWRRLFYRGCLLPRDIRFVSSWHLESNYDIPLLVNFDTTNTTLNHIFSFVGSPNFIWSPNIKPTTALKIPQSLKISTLWDQYLF